MIAKVLQQMTSKRAELHYATYSLHIFPYGGRPIGAQGKHASTLMGRINMVFVQIRTPVLV